MTVRTAAGTRFYISANTPPTFNQAGYENSVMVWTEIGEIVNGGQHGRKYNEVTHLPIASRGTQKFKGSYNEGTKTLQLGSDLDDVGQILLKTALNSDNDYSFRIVYNGGDVDYFQAKVMSFEKATESADSIVAATVELSITTAPSTGVGVIEVNVP